MRSATAASRKRQAEQIGASTPRRLIGSTRRQDYVPEVLLVVRHSVPAIFWPLIESMPAQQYAWIAIKDSGEVKQWWRAGLEIG